MMRGCAEVVRRPHKPKVVGSSPTPARHTVLTASTWCVLDNAKLSKKYRGVAELVDAEEPSIWF